MFDCFREPYSDTYLTQILLQQSLFCFIVVGEGDGSGGDESGGEHEVVLCGGNYYFRQSAWSHAREQRLLLSTVICLLFLKSYILSCFTSAMFT